MIVYAAIDLRGGRVVQLIGGVPERERLSLPDPLATVERFVAAGFDALHVVDLDGALDGGSNQEVIRAVLRAAGVSVQVGGGVRDEDAVQGWIAAGADRVIVGTRATTEPGWLAAVSQAHPDRIVVAADVRHGMVLSHGWTKSTGKPVEDVLVDLDDLPLAGVLITDVGREGKLQGVDIDLFARLNRSTQLPIIAAGGIRSIEDLRNLSQCGVGGAVVGTALYTGAIDPVAVTKEFNHR